MDISNLSRGNRRLLAILSGALLGLAFPPTGIAGSFLAFVALAPLLIAINGGTRLRDAFRTGWLAMFCMGVVSNYWVGGWKGIGDVDPFLMVGGLLLMVVHPFFLIIPILLYDWTRRRFGPQAAQYSLPVYFMGFELWHCMGDLSYPWLNLYNTQTYNLCYVQFIEWTGPYLLTAFIVLINVMLFRLLTENGPKWKPAAWIAALLVVPYVYGGIAMSTTEESKSSVRVTVVQPNINPWEKWQSDKQRILDTNFASSRTALAKVHDSSDVLLWPETAITFYITDPSDVFELRRFFNFVGQSHIAVLTGFADMERFQLGRDSIPEDGEPSPDPLLFFRHFNAAMLAYAAPDGIHLSKYHKQKLVPLGEHIPFIGMFPVLGKVFKWGVGLGGWSVGQGYGTLPMPVEGGRDTARFNVMICYESIYPSFIRNFVNEGANILAVITNDGWYGESSGPHQHNQFAALRAIENRRWLVRSANTGISSVIDDRGRFVEETPLTKSASITQRIPLIERKTYYTRFGDFIAIPSLMYCGIVVVAGIGMRIREKRRKKKD